MCRAAGCALRGVLDITRHANPGRLAQYKKVKGASYSGAGLSGLAYSIDSANGEYNLVFRDVETIVD